MLMHTHARVPRVISPTPPPQSKIFGASFREQRAPAVRTSIMRGPKLGQYGLQKRMLFKE